MFSLYRSRLVAAIAPSVGLSRRVGQAANTIRSTQHPTRPRGPAWSRRGSARSAPMGMTDVGVQARPTVADIRAEGSASARQGTVPPWPDTARRRSAMRPRAGSRARRSGSSGLRPGARSRGWLSMPGCGSKRARRPGPAKTRPGRREHHGSAIPPGRRASPRDRRSRTAGSAPPPTRRREWGSAPTPAFAEPARACSRRRSSR